MMDFNPNMSLEELEKLCIQHRMRWWKGNKTQTANTLGIAIRTLDAKLEKYGDDDRTQRDNEEREGIERERVLARMRGVTAEAVRETGPSINSGASAGVRMESIANAPTEQPVSLPKQLEVQKVLPSQTPASGKGRRS